MLRSDVVDREGRLVGTLQDMMVDVRRGRVAYAVVALDQPWGERLVAVPWNATHRDGDGNVRVDARREWVECAPSVKPGFMPSLLDHEWAVLVHSYFGTKPYWEHDT